MEPERWQRIEQLYHLALGQPGDSRSAFVAEACGDDQALRQEIESLLAADEGAETYLEKPATEAIAGIARGAAAPRSNLPTQLGRYEIAGRLGAGSMGTVYRGIDPVINRAVAIKAILQCGLEASAGGLELRARLLREARAAGRLSHPNIVTVFDAGEEAGVTYIVMELIEGSALDALLPAPPAVLPPARALAILAEVAAALDYAHGRGVVHRDVKPSNIVIQADGTAKLADFGIALQPKATLFTTPGTTPGTPYYMSPEQLRGEEATPRSDQFSLAVLAWLLLTGARPFDSEHLMPLLAQILEQAPPENTQLTAAADGVLRRALSKYPEERFPSCVSFVAALRDACPGTAVGPKSTPLRRLPVWAAIAGVACLLAGAGVAWRLRSHESPPMRQVQTKSSTNQSAIVPPPPVDSQPKGSPNSPARKAQLPSGERSAVNDQPSVDRPAAGAVKTNAIDHQGYVWIPAGAFDLGCSNGDHGCDPNERPLHHVTISGFWIGQTEVTAEAYRRFASATGHALPPEPIFAGRNLNPGWADGRQPVVNVTWEDARAFCGWAGMRLPTEAEWEYSARGRDPRPRYGSAEEVSWFRNNSGKAHFDNAPPWMNDPEKYEAALRDNENGPRPVGGKPPNGYGLYDMLGNAQEWVNDWFRRNYYSWSPVADPQGPDFGTTRVIRGGSWYDGPRLINPSRRHSSLPSTRDVYTGFRCAGTL